MQIDHLFIRISFMVWLVLKLSLDIKNCITEEMLKIFVVLQFLVSRGEAKQVDRYKTISRGNSETFLPERIVEIGTSKCLTGVGVGFKLETIF